MIYLIAVFLSALYFLIKQQTSITGSDLRSNAILKRLFQFFVIPVVCHALLCTEAMAKKDKPDDSDKNKKSERNKKGESEEEGASGGGGGTSSEGKSKPQQPHQKSKPGQQQAPQKVQKKDPDPSRKPAKANEDKPAKKDMRPSKDDSGSPSTTKRKDDDPTGKGKDDDVNSKRKDNNPDDIDKKQVTKDTKDKDTKDNKPNKPMDIPGKRPDADKDDKKKVTKDTKDNKPDKPNKPMDIPGKRPDTDSIDKKKVNKDTKDKDTKDNKPNKPLALPGKRPKVPGADKDKKPDHPDVAKRDKDKKPDHPDIAKHGKDKKPDLPNGNRKKAEPKKQVVVRPGQNTKKVRRVEFNNNTKNWWVGGNTVNSNNNNVRITNVTNVNYINNNFSQNVNWSTHRNHWGYNPWWNRPAVRPWYGSSWNCRWSSSYYRHHYHYGHHHGYRPPGYYEDDVVESIGWGLIGWSLGAMIYDTGYRSYHNPYPVRPVYVSNTTQVTYSEPITQVAVRYVPPDDAVVKEGTRKSESLIAESQTAFKQRNYLVALEFADKAIAASPGDGALHEYRALILFNLGKYGEAAGVLNPVLASGPGWDWATMIALYDAQKTYTDQLQKLEAYTEEKPDSADTHFLLGYHYMVCGHMDLATPQFDMAVKLMPKDNVSKELAELTRNSARTDEDGKPVEVQEEPVEAPAPEPVPLEKLAGTWVSSRDASSSITLVFKDDGKFSWTFVKGEKTTAFSGEYSINDDGLLVLDSSESQMVANVELSQETEMKFVLQGGPPKDPGLAFKKI